MRKTLATLKTDHAARYLTQLCKHFAHNIDVSYEGDHGECRFASGTATLGASNSELLIKVTSPDDARLEETQSVVERHLVRFAFREDIAPLQWVHSTIESDSAEHHQSHTSSSSTGV